MSLTIYNVPNFEKHRVKFLELIYKIPETRYKDISHTDWEITKSMRREYVEYFNENIYQGYRDNLCKENQFKDFEISNMWFQVYRRVINMVNTSTRSFHKCFLHQFIKTNNRNKKNKS